MGDVKAGGQEIIVNVQAVKAGIRADSLLLRPDDFFRFVYFDISKIHCRNIIVKLKRSFNAKENHKETNGIFIIIIDYCRLFL